jgi:hypothetical protein
MCPYLYKLSREERPRILVPTSPKAVLGEALHDAVNRFLYQILNDNPRMKKLRQKRLAEGKNDRYFYLTSSGFLKFCAGLIIASLEGESSTSHLVRNKRPIRWPEDASPKQIEELKERLLLTGLAMARDYYIANQEKPAPFLREQPLRASIRQEVGSGVVLSGRIDQARKNSFDRVYIIDLKFGFDGFEWQLSKATDEATRKTIVLTQLETDPQIIAYWILYEKKYGTPPHRVGFYYLQSGQYYFVECTAGQIDNFFEIIRSILISGEKENFPPLGMYHGSCRYCAYSGACKHYQQAKARKVFTIEEAEECLPQSESLMRQLENELKEINYEEQRLKLTRQTR